MLVVDLPCYVSCKQRLVLPDGNMTALHYGELEVITGDNSGCVSVWWIESNELLQSFKAHDASITSLQVDAVKAISGSLDKTIVISDVIRGQRLQALRGMVHHQCYIHIKLLFT